MNQLSNTVRALEARMSALELEYARLHERLRTVGAALGGATPPPRAQESAPAEAPVPQAIRQTGKRAKSTDKAAALPRRPPTEGAAPAVAAKSTGTKKPVPSPSAKKATPGARTDGPRKWFEKGEAVELFHSILKRPMSSGDLMARVVAAKRKAKLPKEDLERFKWAVQSALKLAISAKSIVRQDDGTIAVAPTHASAAGKAPRRAKK